MQGAITAQTLYLKKSFSRRVCNTLAAEGPIFPKLVRRVFSHRTAVRLTLHVIYLNTSSTSFMSFTSPTSSIPFSTQSSLHLHLLLLLFVTCSAALSCLFPGTARSRLKPVHQRQSGGTTGHSIHALTWEVYTLRASLRHRSRSIQEPAPPPLKRLRPSTAPHLKRRLCEAASWKGQWQIALRWS